MSNPSSQTSPLHVTGEVLAAKTVGAHRHLTLVAPGIGERSRPGSFIALSTGDARLARRALWIHRVRPMGGHPATLEVVVDPRGSGTRWLADLTPGAAVEVTGPLGRPFALPREPARCLLVGEGYAAGPLLALAERLRDRSCPVHLVLCAPDESHLLDVLEARRSLGRVDVAIGEVIGGAIDGVISGAEVLYAAGTLPILRACADSAGAAGISCQVALERPLTCATGLCQGCPVPRRDRDGDGEGGRLIVRDCVEGPVFRAEVLDWDAL
jgi:dihydroorotate dehydrogenase electron transfer subunit